MLHSVADAAAQVSGSTTLNGSDTDRTLQCVRDFDKALIVLFGKFKTSR